MSVPGIRDCLAAAIEFLDELHVPHMLMGAHFLGFYGAGRATRDVDLMLASEGTDVLGQVRQNAEQRGFETDREWEGAYPDIQDVHLRLVWHEIPVDFMLPRDDHDRSACTRRRPHQLGGRTVWLVAPEDFILQKLKVGRPRDFDDVIPFFVQHRDELDHPYLNSWALRLGVREELDYLWSQSAERP